MAMLESCKLVNLPRIDDDRGSLSFVEGNNHVPFDIARIFYLYNLAPGATRGDYAHKLAKQFFIAIHGSFDVTLDDGTNKKKFTLDKPNIGLYVPTMIWGLFTNFSKDSVCLVLSDRIYEEEDYIRNYHKFISIIKGK